MDTHEGEIPKRCEKPFFWQRRPGRNPTLEWLELLAISAVLMALFHALRFPAALLLGAMVAAAACAVTGATIRIPHLPFIIAQGAVGCMIAMGIPDSILSQLFRDWPFYLAGMFTTMAAAAFLGWLLTRSRILPGTTAIWGFSPGAATAMIVMSEAYGADMRLVAFMQYLRLFCIALVASAVSRIWADTPAGELPPVAWFPPVAWMHFAGSLTVIVFGVMLVRIFRVSGGYVLVPMVLGAVARNSGLLNMELPPAFLAASYAIMGWTVGLRFTRDILTHALKALPRILAATFVLIAVCGCFAAFLVPWGGISPLTAFLATSPGAVDTIAIIAASSDVDIPFIMAMQTCRLLLVMLTGPSLARYISSLSEVDRIDA
ncbi:MAG: AbrB family transcriptional regulator [Planctomycetes bacterium]|nr:AbrB family transcriptional regulator [Planctomycetota bacterium]